MKDILNNLKHVFCRSAVRLTIFLLLLFAYGEAVHADNTEFEQSHNFEATIKGRGVIHFKVLIWSEGGYNHWAYKDGNKQSYIRIKVPNGNGGYDEENIFYYRGDNDRNKHNEYGSAWITFNEDKGKLMITNISGGGTSDPQGTINDKSFSLKRDNNGNRRKVYLEADWYMAEAYAQKNFDIITKVYEKRTNWSYEHDYEMMGYQAADPIPSPELYQATFYPSAGVDEAGRTRLAIPYSITQKPQSYVTNQSSNRIDTEDLSGMIFTESHDSAYAFNITMRIPSNTVGATVDVKSNTIIVPAYHSIHDFKVTDKIDTVKVWKSLDDPTPVPVLVNRGHKRLTWMIKHPTEDDIMPADIFEIQRATNENFTDAETIGTVEYISGSFNADSEQTENDEPQLYEYVDSTAQALYNKENPGEAIYYRIRRVTSSVWGWKTAYSGSEKDGTNLRQVNIESAEIRRDGIYLNRYEQNHEVTIDIKTPAITPLGTDDKIKDTRWWDEHSILNIKRIDDNNNEALFGIEADSMHLILGPVVDGKQQICWAYRFKDEMPTACVNYRYEASIDTKSASIYADPMTNYGPVAAKTANDLSMSRFETIPAITSITATKGEHKRFTVIEWETAASGIEYYEIYRDGKLLDGSLYDQNYVDSTGIAGQSYRYYVIGRMDCHGSKSTTSQTCEGFRSPFGSISGRVQYADGTAMSGVKVKITRDKDPDALYPEAITKDMIKDEYEIATTTDGSFFADSIAYSLHGSTFSIIVQSDWALFDNDGLAAVNLQMNSPERTVSSFVTNSMARISGRVLFDGSTVPVPGVSFLLNGQPVRTAQGQDIITDNTGNFTVTVPLGGHFTLQAYKEGHTFQNNGFFQVTDGDNDIKLEKNKDGLRMHDLTKVRLMGRIVGGGIEASHPLGFGLSHNNLGDNLQLVLELEGDNISHLVFDEKDLALNERVEDFAHLTEGQHTSVKTSLKRITINPDANTGEFQLDLYPARYRVVQANALNYGSLLPAGTAIPTIDLSGKPEEKISEYNGNTITYNADYCITYHSPVTISYEQVVYGNVQPYLGDRQFEFLPLTTMEGKKLQLVTKAGDGTYNYVLGHPVFSTGNIYSLRIKAHEDYYYNNVLTGDHQQVMLGNCPTKIYNGLEDESRTIEGTLNSDGYQDFVINASNTNFQLTGEDALRSINVSVLVDGEYVQANPLKAYVTGSRQKGHGIINNPYVQKLSSAILLNDVLRDPPGSASYAFIEKGSVYETKLQNRIDIEIGANINISLGTSFKNVTGASSGVGPFSGVVMEGETVNPVTIPATMKKHYYQTYTYRHTTSERISTSNDMYMVGKPATVYIGTEPTVYALRKESFGVIDHDTYKRCESAIKEGGIRIVAEGLDNDGTPIYLVISEELGFGTACVNDFAYTEDHILTQIIPATLRQRNSLLVTGTEEEIQRVANATGKVQYLSLVPIDCDSVGSEGNYKMIKPEKLNSIPVDEVKAYNDYILEWVSLIQREEATLIMSNYISSNHLKTYNIAGAPVDYSESVEAEYDYQNKNGDSGGMVGTGIGVGGKVIGSALGKGLGALSDKLFGTAASQFQDMLNKVKGSTGSYGQVMGEDVYNNDEKASKATAISGLTPGSSWKITIDPVLQFSSVIDNNQKTGMSRTVGFHIEDEPYSTLSVKVNRITDSTNAFTKSANEILEYAANVDPSVNYVNTYKAGDFAYYLMGGATRNPYEGPTTTIFYMPGTVIAPGSQRLEIPNLKVDVHEISNVPEDEAAIFDLTISLDCEQKDYVNFASQYKLLLLDNTNPLGAKLFIDGQAIAGGRTFDLIPGKTILHKILEVKRGVGYDFEDITLRLRSESDIDSYADAKFSVHFTPSSTPVELGLVSDNWVLNTLSPKDSVGYYLPLEIKDFDVHYNNFDHIEFQYKLATESNDAWVNLCSYYANDSLYTMASGNKERITNGVISNIRFYGERDPMEQHYDLRAVSYCRLGTGYVTRSSKVYSGLKDTRTPDVFGGVTPKDGILGYGDHIGIQFSEDIAGNYLDEDNNFQVIGYTNSFTLTNITHPVFDGTNTCNAHSEVTRTVGENGFTIDMMVNPAHADSLNTFFCIDQKDGAQGSLWFGMEKRKLQLYLQGRGSKAEEINSKTIVESGVSNMGWTRVAVTYDAQTHKVRFYVGSEDVTNQKANTIKNNTDFSVNGNIYLGGDKDGNAPFTGGMLEARIWNRTLDADEIAATNQKTLTGYERGLLAYYPLNEGYGCESKDVAHGATLTHEGTTWNLPAGRSIYFDAQKNKEGIRIAEDKFTRTKLHDYTLMFWFKANTEQAADTVALFAAGRGIKEELSAQGKLFIGLENGHVIVRQNGFTASTSGNYLDNEWHNVCLTVAHSSNEAVLHIDGEAAQHFAADNMLGIVTEDLRLGACGWATMDATPKNTFPFTGYIDDVTLFDAACSTNYYQQIYPYAVNGSEMSLLCSLNFQQRELNDFSSYNTYYSPYNAKVFKDTEGNVVKKNERLVLTSDDVVKEMSSTLSAPIREQQELEKMNFSWISRENELVVNLNMLDKEINHQNIFVTVRDVEDLAGNLLRNPVSMTVFVDRNPLKWQETYIYHKMKAGESSEFSVNVKNRTGKTVNYVVEDMPSWLSSDQQTDYMLPTEESAFYFYVSDDITPGTHSAILQLTDEDGLSDPLLVTIKVEADEPDWTVDPKFDQTMNLVGEVMVENNVGGDTDYYIDTDKDDLVAAFIDGKCVGRQYISSNVATSANLMLSIKGASTMFGQPVSFRLWRAATGKSYLLKSEQVIFNADAMYGNVKNPVEMRTAKEEILNIDLAQGWNWVSFNVMSNGTANSVFTPNNIFTDNDVVKSYKTLTASTYSSKNGGWTGSLNDIDYRNIYMMQMSHPARMEISGARLSTNEERTVEITKGWNELPCFLSSAASINDALSDYYDNASNGDIIKSYNEFALFDDDTKRWIGSLTQMKPGEGYLLKHNADEPCTITFYQGRQMQTTAESAPRRTHDIAARTSSAMPIVAIAENVAEPDDQLLAFADGQLIGAAEADAEGRYFIMTHADEGSNISFALERDGDIVAETAPEVTFVSEAVVGSLAKPYSIDFSIKVAEVGPSPFTSELIWKTSCSEGEHVRFDLISSAGQTVATHTAVASATFVTYKMTNLDALAPGIYLARITKGNESTVVKVVKNNQ